MEHSLETLLLELYRYRVPSKHNNNNDVIYPFSNVPIKLMKKLDREYLLLKAQEEDEESI